MGESTSNFPNAWERAAATVPEDELPIVVGVVGIDGKVRVNEADLEPGRYRVRAGKDGEIVGEVEVTDPVTHIFKNRAARRKEKYRHQGVQGRNAAFRDLKKWSKA